MLLQFGQCPARMIVNLNQTACSRLLDDERKVSKTVDEAARHLLPTECVFRDVYDLQRTLRILFGPSLIKGGLSAANVPIRWLSAKAIAEKQGITQCGDESWIPFSRNGVEAHSGVWRIPKIRHNIALT